MATRTPARQRLRGFLSRYRRRPSTTGGELDALAAAINFGRLTDEQFIQLLEALFMLSETKAGVELATMRTDSLVTLIARASKGQLRALSNHPTLRPFIIEEIFRRMSDHLIPEKTKYLSAVVSWRFPAANGQGGYDKFQTVVEEGTCVSAGDLGREPDTTVTLSVYDFLRMATGVAAVAPMFVAGRVKVKGDYALAAMFSTYFDIPKPN